LRLRVLIPESIADPVALIEQALREQNVEASTALTTATLEDVFVAVTMKSAEEGA
jgi:hypothetical protein